MTIAVARALWGGRAFALALLAAALGVLVLAAAPVEARRFSALAVEGQPFTLSIVGRNGEPISLVEGGYVPLRHKEKYTLRLTNNASVRAAVLLTMDGTPWDTRIVVDPYSSVDIETIPGTGKRLTFFAKGTREAQAALLDGVPAGDLGLVSATFSREVPPPQRPRQAPAPWDTRGDSDSLARKSVQEESVLGSASPIGTYGAGGTGLSGRSDQDFENTAFQDDQSWPEVTLTLRLVERKRAPKPPQLDAHPIPGRPAPVSSLVPAPVGP